MKILLVQLASMGDCLFVTTIARQMKEIDYPGCHLTWLIGDKYQQVLINNPFIDEIIVAPIPSPEGGREALQKILNEVVGKKKSYDKVINTEYVPDNYSYFYGPTRSCYFKVYGKKITVSPEPILFLTDAEKENVDTFARRNGLNDKNTYPILLEYTPNTCQSSMNIKKAQIICSEILSIHPQVRFILSSDRKLENVQDGLIDGSVLTWRENAELTKYCKLLIGCSSGITWLNTSTAAAKIPMVQSICAERKYFRGVVSPSVELDFMYCGLSTEKLIEFIDAEDKDIVKCIDMILSNSFEYAKNIYKGRPHYTAKMIDAYFFNRKLYIEGKTLIGEGTNKVEIQGETSFEISEEYGNKKNKVNKNHLIFTIIARNYVSQAVTLGDSLHKHADNVLFIPVLCDTFKWELPLLFASHPDFAGRFEWMCLDELEYPNVPAMVLRYDPTEFCTAIKAALFMHFIEKYPDVLISYFDPDILVYGKLKELETVMKEASFTLIPHIMSDPYDKGGITIYGVHSAGIFNLGYIGVNPNFSETIRILRWWRDRLEFECVSKQPELFVDQKWMDFIPAFAEFHKIFRHPGYNVAYWNLHERKLSEQGGRILVNGEPLKFYHFSGYIPTRLNELSKYQKKFVLSEMPILKRLTDDYAVKLMAADYTLFSLLDYANNYSLKSRQFIPPDLRAKYLAKGRNVSHLAFDPFDDPWIVARLKKVIPENLYPQFDLVSTNYSRNKLRKSINGNFLEEDVRRLYRSLLGREPESDAVILHHLTTALSLEGLEACIKSSEEYKKMNIL